MTFFFTGLTGDERNIRICETHLKSSEKWTDIMETVA